MNGKKTKIFHLMPQLHLPGHHSSFSNNVVKELKIGGVINEGLHNGYTGHDWIGEYNLKNKKISDYIVFPFFVNEMGKLNNILNNIGPAGNVSKKVLRILKHVTLRIKESIEILLVFVTLKLNKDQQKHDLIFIHDFPRNFGLFISSLLRIIPKNTLVDIHVYTNGTTKLPKNTNFLYKIYYHIMLNKINILFHSKALYDYYENKIKLSRDNLFYVPYGLATDCETIDKKVALKSLNIDTNKKIILFIGTMRKDKGIDLTIESLKKMDDKKYFFLLAGSMSHLLDYNVDSLISSIGWNDSYKRISLEDNSSYEDFQNYFSAADVLVLPYNKTFIGASGVLANAAEFGLPVIGPEHGQIGEFINKFNLGLTFEAENINSFVDSIERFFELDKKEIESFKIGLSNMKQEQSWSNVAGELIEISKTIN
ncbi:glycosyltransferase [Methanococcoides orientis]|uniref:glycosyltransferase family 4 protein n=1 Tax=Methanococcoides orientis TaxID=2822137 RepID=UPI001E2F2745|nr:glycosyltransferase family 4 protein [Methanococcoides orientis]UGV40302.1 glycosyltransferase [Methanococcoides orientis]